MEPHIPPYVRSQLPVIPGGEKKWLDDELKKIEDTLRAVLNAISVLRSKVP